MCCWSFSRFDSMTLRFVSPLTLIQRRAVFNFSFSFSFFLEENAEKGEKMSGSCREKQQQQHSSLSLEKNSKALCCTVQYQNSLAGIFFVRVSATQLDFNKQCRTLFSTSSTTSSSHPIIPLSFTDTFPSRHPSSFVTDPTTPSDTSFFLFPLVETPSSTLTSSFFRTPRPFFILCQNVCCSCCW